MDTGGGPSGVFFGPARARWWVGFLDTDTGDWFQTFTRKGFRHCFCFREIADEVILSINPLRWGIDIRSIYGRPCEWIEREKAVGARIVTVVTQTQPSRMLRRAPIITCASTCAYAMSLDSRVVTPYGLYRKIMARGGREV